MSAAALRPLDSPCAVCFEDLSPIPHSGFGTRALAAQFSVRSVGQAQGR